MNVLFVRAILFLSLFCSMHSISAVETGESPLYLSFQELERRVGEGEGSLAEIDGSTIQIRGFLYTANGGQTVLASEPNLKTCCVGSEAKRKKQVAVHGDRLPTASSDFAVTLIGLLEVDPNGQFLFSLKNSAVAESSQQNLSLWILGSLILLPVIGLAFRIRKI